MKSLASCFALALSLLMISACKENLNTTESLTTRPGIELPEYAKWSITIVDRERWKAQHIEALRGATFLIVQAFNLRNESGDFFWDIKFRLSGDQEDAILNWNPATQAYVVKAEFLDEVEGRDAPLVFGLLHERSHELKDKKPLSSIDSELRSEARAFDDQIDSTNVFCAWITSQPFFDPENIERWKKDCFSSNEVAALTRDGILTNLFMRRVLIIDIAYNNSNEYAVELVQAVPLESWRSLVSQFKQVTDKLDDAPNGVEKIPYLQRALDSVRAFRSSISADAQSNFKANGVEFERLETSLADAIRRLPTHTQYFNELFGPVQ